MVAKALETSSGRRKVKGSGHLALSVMESWQLRKPYAVVTGARWGKYLEHTQSELLSL